VIKIYLQEDNDENENIGEIDRLSKIRDVQKTAKEKIINKLSHSKNIPYKRFFRYFCILENRLFKYYKKEY